MADAKVRDDKWRASNWLADAGVSDMTYVRDPEGDLTRDFAEVRAEGFAAGVAQERERCLKACDDFDSAADAAAAIRAGEVRG